MMPPITSSVQRVFDTPTASPPQEHIQGDQWFTDYQVGKQYIYH